MPQRFNSSQSEDAMSYAISWPTLEDGSDVEFPSADLWPEAAIIAIEAANELFQMNAWEEKNA